MIRYQNWKETRNWGNVRSNRIRNVVAVLSGVLSLNVWHDRVAWIKVLHIRPTFIARQLCIARYCYSVSVRLSACHALVLCKITGPIRHHCFPATDLRTVPVWSAQRALNTGGVGEIIADFGRISRNISEKIHARDKLIMQGYVM